MAASFELNCKNDGHVKALARAITMASRISRDGILDFHENKLKICSKTEHLLVKFQFSSGFFTDYTCKGKHRCYVNLKALLTPFKSSILVSEKEHNFSRPEIKMKCTVEDELNNQIIFIISGSPTSASLTYRLSINDFELCRGQGLSFNRSYENPQVSISPRIKSNEKFLLSAFNNFAPDIDQVSIMTTPTGVLFIGSSDTLLSGKLHTTSEFSHGREDFSTYNIKEDVKVTMQLRPLKLFLSFVEGFRTSYKNITYEFEGIGEPAHFMYTSDLFRGHFTTSTLSSHVFDSSDDYVLPIEAGPNESFLVDENIIQAPDLDIYENEESYLNLQNGYDIDNDDDDYQNGYNDNKSSDEDESNFLDGNLEGLNVTGNFRSGNLNNSTTSINLNNSIFGGAESIRSEMTDREYDPEKVRELINLDEDPNENENVEINYSSGEDEYVE